MNIDCVAPLFVPGHRPDRFTKAAASGADAVIIDLEDAVPFAEKAAARAALDVTFTTLPVFVRINGASTSWFAEDVAAVQKVGADAVMLPKADASISKLAGILAGLDVFALLESAQGIADARAVAALPWVSRVAFGSVDYSTDMGCEETREALLLARSEIVLASRLAGKPAPLDGVTTTLDERAAHDDARHARALGFGGKLTIHPRQIEAVKRAFLPSSKDIEWARKVVASGDGAVAVDGAMVDEPVRRRARRMLELAGGGA